ncbi:MAG: hypothetical protein GY947_16055 [Rhodobacteraceae bacterium]|nr:hypothetical protein [Paracoccaceae bacterium]
MYQSETEIPLPCNHVFDVFLRDRDSIEWQESPVTLVRPAAPHLGGQAVHHCHNGDYVEELTETLIELDHPSRVAWRVEVTDYLVSPEHSASPLSFDHLQQLRKRLEQGAGRAAIFVAEFEKTDRQSCRVRFTYDDNPGFFGRLLTGLLARFWENPMEVAVALFVDHLSQSTPSSA